MFIHNSWWSPSCLMSHKGLWWQRVSLGRWVVLAATADWLSKTRHWPVSQVLGWGTLEASDLITFTKTLVRVQNWLCDVTTVSSSLLAKGSLGQGLNELFCPYLESHFGSFLVWFEILNKVLIWFINRLQSEKQKCRRHSWRSDESNELVKSPLI